MRELQRCSVSPLSVLKNAHAGRAAVIMGGGMSLPEQLVLAPEGAVFISANQHGCFLRQCDYIVAVDRWSKKKFLAQDGTEKKLRDLGVPIISPRREDADYMIYDNPFNNSGVAASFAAWVMGCAPIILAGMDCYVGGTYFHNAKAPSSGKGLKLEHHFARWRKLIAAVPGIPLRVVSGPLSKLLPLYDKEEVFPQTGCVGKVVGISGTKVRTKRDWNFPPFLFPQNELIELTAAELNRGLRDGAVVKVTNV